MAVGTNGESLSINDVNKMIDDVGDIATYNQQLANDMTSVRYIIQQIDSHWISEEADKISAISTLTNLEEKFSAEILPVFEQFVVAMNSLIQSSVTTSKNTN